MRLSFFAIAALCLLSVAAHADNYTITDQGAGPNQPGLVVGNFNYDGSTFSNFLVSVGGQSFDFTALANQGFMTPGQGDPCQVQSTFQYLTATGSCNPEFDAYIDSTASHSDTVEFVIPDPRQSGVLHRVAKVNQPNLASFPTLLPANIGLVDNSTAAPPSSVTPEPSSLVLLGTGLLGIFGVARRRFA